MNTNIADFNLSEVMNAKKSLEERFEKVVEAWQSDPNFFEKLYEETNLANETFLVLEGLERKNQWKDIEKLDRVLQCQPKYYEENSKFISQSLIALYLAADREDGREQTIRIENCLKLFYKDPTNYYEVFAEVLDKLICYDQSSIVVDLCKKTYPLIANSDQFFINPKDNIAEIIIWSELQEAYVSIKNGLEIDWNTYSKRFENYEYIFAQDDFKTLEEIMKGGLNIVEIFKIFKEKGPFVLFQIKLAFGCKMYDLDGTSFVTSNNYASKIIDFLARIPGREKCPLQTFFKIKPDLFKKHLLNLGDDGWFETVYNQFAFLGAIPIFLLSLLQMRIIEIKALEEILPAVNITKSEFKNLHSEKPWVFNFINKLESQASALAQLGTEC